MSLLTRLVDPLDGEEKLPVHEFMAALREYARGAPGVDLAAISAAFGLSQEEETQLANFISNINGMSASQKIQYATQVHDVLLLGEGGQYPLATVMSRLQIS